MRKKNRSKKKWIAGLVLLIVFAVASSRGYVVIPDIVQRSMSYVVYPLLLLQQRCVAPVKAWLQRRNAAQELEKELAHMQQEKESLLSQIIQLQALTNYADDIKELVDFKERYNGTGTIVAQVLVRHISDQSQSFIVDVGATQGVTKNMVAVYKDNLVGRVVQVYPWYSKILLITDRLCKVSAYCAATKAIGIHTGVNQAGQGILTRVSHLHAVQDGDLIFSSGDGLVFPRGFALGRVVTHTQKDLFHEITTQPLIDIHNINYCYLLGNRESGEVEE